jgi:hypothetical protein
VFFIVVNASGLVFGYSVASEAAEHATLPFVGQGACPARSKRGGLLLGF